MLTGFNLAPNGNFTRDQTVILKQVYDRINSDDCKNFINKILGDNRIATDRDSLGELISRATLTMYDDSYTAEQLGVSPENHILLRDAFNNLGDPTAHAQGIIFFGALAFQREWSSVLPQRPSNWNFDTATAVVHELLHVAGLRDPQVSNLNSEIKANCGFQGMRITPP